MRLLLLLIALVPTVGLAFSSAPRQDLDPQKVYAHDIQLTVNGIQGQGIMVVPKAESYTISGISRGSADLLTITTCHRDVALYPGKNKFEYIYQPSESLEARGGCPLHIGAYDKKGQHAWAIVDFEDDEAKLPGFLKCNGYGKTWDGVSICQSRQTLVQFIEFKVPVRTSPSSNCPMPGSVDGKGMRFEFPIVRGECVYAFMEQGGAHRIHRLTTIGYESVLLRED